MKFKKWKIKGSVLIETIIATALFTMLSSVILLQLVNTRETQYNAYLYNQASQLTKEGMEAMISIKWVGSDTGSWDDQNGFSTLTSGVHYLSKDADENWELTTTTSEVINNTFYRSILIEDVDRLDNGRGNIDTTWTGTGESLLPSGVVTKKITIRVEWQNIDWNTWQIEFSTYLINWGNPLIFAN